MIKLFRFLALMLSVGTTSGCNSYKADAIDMKAQALNVPDTVIKDIPDFFQREEWREYFYKLQKLLSIESIEDGFNEWQIRFWISHGYTEKDSSQVIIFKRKADQISGTLETYIHPYVSLWDDTATSISHRVTSIKPKSGWAKFIEKITTQGIYDLSDLTILPGYYTNADSYGVTVEVSTPEKYRIYYYPDYEIFKDTIEEAEKMFKIMSLIEEELGVKVIY